MNEYNYEFEEIRNDIDERPAKPKRHIGLQIVASLTAMVMVSAGSIAVYSHFDKHPENSVSQNYTASDKVIDAENVGLIKTEEHSSSGAMSTEDVVDKVLPSVVGIESKFTIQSSGSSNSLDGIFGFGFGFGGNSEPSTREATGTGTGIIITENGYIITNAHVIYDSEYGSGVSKNISVLLSDEKTYDADVVGYDVECDLAVLKIKAEGLTPADFGDSDSLRLGESVVAIGNPLGFELMDTVTSGIISGKNRSITIKDHKMNLLQTDASINAGNSGGPLVNKYGQVIGINSSKMSSSYMSGEASIEGIGFAIPANEAAGIVEDLIKFGYVTGKPQLGISCQDVTESISKMYDMPMGVYVVDVAEDSAADKAGMRKGDIITGIDGEDVKNIDELNEKKNVHSAGDTVTLTYVRDGEEHDVDVVLDEVKKTKE